MKNKLFIILATISVLSLSGCGSDNKNNTSTSSETTTISETETEKKEIQNEIKIYTINDNIDYKKLNDDDEIGNEIKTLADEIKQNKFISIDNNENIRIDFGDIHPLNNTVSVEKTFVSKDKIISEEEADYLMVSENNTLDITNTFNNDDIGIVYNISFETDTEEVDYLFAINKLNEAKKEDSKEEVKNTSNSETYLSNGELKIYEEYKKDLDKKILKNKEPIFIAKLYAQAIINEDYSVAYSLYEKSDDNPSEEEFIKIINSFSENTKKEFIENIKAVKNGKFVKDGDDGYIEYEVVENHPLVIDMTKDNDVWLLEYLPLQ